MSARTTDDYEAMAAAGIVAIVEPAFWVGQPRTSADSFNDYFASLVGFERFRAGQFGIRHYCAIGLNSKEANNERVAEGVFDLLPLYVGKEGVVAVGEIGYDDMTAAEDKWFRKQIELALEVNLPVMVHTPHRNKKAGTSRSMDVCVEMGIDPNRVIIDHNNEETAQETIERGFWAAFTIYPKTMMGNERMVEVVKKYGAAGAKRIIVDSSSDWGVSDPLAVPKTANLMLERGVDPAVVEAVCYRNALTAYGQSGNMHETDWLNPAPIDQRTLFEGNSVLRGQEPKIEAAKDGRVIE
jgi:predicted metal-dependent TIM-barrel fold hydrolase